jgi:peptide/nickel transport system substrate-binding protein
MYKYITILLMLILIFSLILGGCAQKTVTPAPATTPAPASTPSPATTPATEANKYGGVLNLGVMFLSTSIGVPWKFRQGDRDPGMLPLEFLIRRGQQAGTYEGRLATNWELAPDKSSYTFHLRKGVKFHDGTEFNAAAVKWNFEKDKAAGRPQFQDVTSIDVIDDYTVRINISKWNSEFLHNFASDTDCALIISPTAYEKNGEEWATTHPVGTGPYKLKDYKENQYTIFEKNPDYWEKGVPYLDEIQYVVVPDPVTFQAALKAGEVDGGGVDLASASNIKATGKFNVWVSFGNLGLAMSYNEKDTNSVWSDKRMREALEYAIDKEKICQTLTYGFCEPTYEIIRGIHGAGDPGTTPRKYDPEKAKALMAQAGHTQLSGINLEFGTFTKMSYGDTILAIQKNLADVGINVELKPIEDATFNQISFQPTNGNDLRIETVRGDPLFPLVRAREDLAENTIYFPGAIRPPGFQQLIDEASATEDPAKVLSLCMQMEKLAYEDVMYVSLWSEPMLMAMSPKVHDADGAYGQVPYPYYERAWKEK